MTTRSQAVCVPRDAVCNRQDDCPAPLVCATDHRCRNSCTRDSDCNQHDTSGRICVEDDNCASVCASSNEADAHTLLTSPAPASDVAPVESPTTFGCDEPSLPSGGTTPLPGGTGAGGKAGAGSAGKPSGGGVSSSAGSSGNAGKAGSGGAPSGPSVCDGQTAVLVDGYVDDFETDQRFTGWYAFSDTSPPDRPLPLRLGPGASLTAFAGQFGAGGIRSSQMMGYGAGFGFGLVDPSTERCLDVSLFDGLSFWIKGSAPGAMLKLQMVAPESQPTDAQPPGDCAPQAPCAFAHPGAEIAVSTSWQHQVVRFADLHSTAFTWSNRRILGFNWITDGPAYSVQVDEVTFYSGSAPPGPVGPGGAGGAP
ncbi:MAG TPA: hypothetical protein VNG33_21800 [Polyangiaceae bacterium]|nr:hypothetical protein [Polyangiaceae bacterium]